MVQLSHLYMRADKTIVWLYGCRQSTWVQSLGCQDPLEKEMATHFSILIWEIPWKEEPGRLQFVGSRRARHNLATKQKCIFTHFSILAGKAPWTQ